MITWVKKLFLTSWLARWFRHAITGAGALLINSKLADPSMAEVWVQKTIELTTSKEFVEGLILILIGLFASKLSDEELEK